MMHPTMLGLLKHWHVPVLPIPSSAHAATLMRTRLLLVGL